MVTHLKCLEAESIHILREAAAEARRRRIWLGFTDADRVENIRRVGEVCHLMAQAELVVVAAFISPFHAEPQMVRDLLEQNVFVEVFVDTPLAVAESRDPKGPYAKGRRGDLANFTGAAAQLSCLQSGPAPAAEFMAPAWVYLAAYRTPSEATSNSRDSTTMSAPAFSRSARA